MSPTSVYSILLVAIGFEVAATTLLAQTAQFTRPLPTIGMAVCYMVAFYCLSLITSSLPVGIVYALWSGLGIVLIAGVNYVIFGQALDTWAMVGVGLILAGVVVINTLSNASPH